MSYYLDGNRFIFNDECPDFSADEILSGLGFPPELIEVGNARRDFEEVNSGIRDIIRMTSGVVYFKMPDKSIPPTPSGTGVAGVILTLGANVTRKSDEYFAQGEYTKGMILNEMADRCLENYKKILEERLRVLSDRKGVGLDVRYEAPETMPVSELRYVWSALNAEENMGVTITSELTLFPVKSACFIMKVKDDTVL